LIAAPGDPMEVRACMRYLAGNPQPSYLRLGKAGEPNFHTTVPDVAPGKWLKMADGVDRGDGRATLLSTGAAMGIAMGWSNAPQYRQHSVHSMPLWSMASKPDQIAAVQPFDVVETLEDHLRDGGFGSWLMEAVVGQPGVETQLRAHALTPVVCGTVGSQKILNALGGLNEQSAPGPTART